LVTVTCLSRGDYFVKDGGFTKKPFTAFRTSCLPCRSLGEGGSSLRRTSRYALFLKMAPNGWWKRRAPCIWTFFLVVPFPTIYELVKHGRTAPMDWLGG